jgi:hypothetical protein
MMTFTSNCRDLYAAIFRFSTLTCVTPGLDQRKSDLSDLRTKMPETG